MKKITLLTIAILGLAFAQDLQTAQSEAQIADNNAEMDSLRTENQRLLAELQAAKQSVQIADTTETETQSVYGSMMAFREQMWQKRAERRAAHTQWREENMWGWGGGFQIGVMNMDARPARNFLRTMESSATILNSSGLADNLTSTREPALNMGGFGYGGVGRGTLIGGGGHRTAFEVQSNPNYDSEITAEVQLHFGGFLIGRRFGNERSAFTMSAMIGGGKVYIDVERSELLFATDWGEELRLNLRREWSSNFFGAEFQLAYTHSVLRWLHVGLEANALLQHSSRGFNKDGDGFTTINPSARLRFIVGAI